LYSGARLACPRSNLRPCPVYPQRNQRSPSTKDTTPHAASTAR
jgi:hypothetical protein